MAITNQQTGSTYTTLLDALNALPATFDKDYSILVAQDVNLGSAALTLPVKTSGSYKLTITFDVATRKIYTDNTQTSTLIVGNINNFVLDKCIVSNPNYGSTSARAILINGSCNSIKLSNVKFDGCAYGVGNSSSFAGIVSTLTLDNCMFQNCSQGATYIGAGTITNGDYTQPSSAYNYTNCTFTKCIGQDVNAKSFIPGTSNNTNVQFVAVKCYNLTVQDCQVLTSSNKGFDFEHCQNLTIQRNYVTDTAWVNANNNPIIINNVLGLRFERNLVADNNNTANAVQVNYNKTTYFNSNTIDTASGKPLNSTNFLDWKELCNNIFWSRGSYVQLVNSTAGLNFNTEFQLAKNNYYRCDGNVNSVNVQVGTTTPGANVTIKSNGDATIATYQGNGYELGSFFVGSGAATGDKAEIFNKGTVSTKPKFMVLVTATASVFQKGDATKGGAKDVRGWNIQAGTPDIGAYDNSATDPTATHNPPQISLSVNRPAGIKSDSTFNFSAAVNFLDTGATASAWLWNFGDGTTSTSQNPSKQYTSLPSSGNTFTVVCTLTDSNGMTDTKTLSVNVYNDGVEIIGGNANGEVYTGSAALMNAATRVFKSSPTGSLTPLTGNISIAIKTTTVQDYFYYSNGDAGNYRVTIYTDLTFTGGQKCWVRSLTSENGVWMQGRTNINWVGLKFTTATGLGGVRCTNGKSNVFIQCDFTDSQYGVYMTGADGYDFYDCTFTRTKVSKMYMNACSNITFVRCNLTYDGTDTESTYTGTRQQLTIGNCSNIRFLKCTISGNGNWDCFIKGNQLRDLIFDGCFIEKFNQQVFWFINGPAGEFNAQRVTIRNNIFKNSMVVAGRGSAAIFDLTDCYYFDIANNTIFEDRAGTAGLRFFNVTGTSAMIHYFNNLLYVKDSNPTAGGAECNIFRIVTTGNTSDQPTFVADHNYYMFQDGARTKIKWGNVNNVSYRNLDNAVGAGLEAANSVQYANDVAATNLIDTTTMEPVAGSPLIGFGTDAIMAPYDYDLNTRYSNGTIGAKEYVKSAYTLTAASFVVTNMSKKANRIEYTSDNVSYNIPSLDPLVFANLFAPLIKDYKWEITGGDYSNTQYAGNFGLFFELEQTYNVKLTITKNDNSTLVINKPGFFVVSKPRPIPEFKISKYRIFKGDKVDFINESQFGATYEWTITNSATTVSETITTENISQKQFDTVGVFDVKLKVTNTIDNDTKEYKRTLHVNDEFALPYQIYDTERAIYYSDEQINVSQYTRFKKKTDVHRWFIHNSNTGDLVYTNPQKSPTIPAGRIPAGDYDILFVIYNKNGSVLNWRRRAFCVLPIASTAPKFNKVCTITDRFVDPISGNSYDGVRVDGTNDNIAPGTIIVLTGEARRVELTYLKGTAEAPIVIVPGQDEFEIKMNSFNGFHMVGCEHVVIAGQLNPSRQKLGFNVHNDTTGIPVHASSSCVNGEYLSTYMRVMGCELWNSGFTAMRMKTEPYGESPQYWRGTGFIQMDTLLHDNEVHDTGGEGMYLGGTTADEATSYYQPSVPDINGNVVTKCFWTPLFNTKVWRNNVYATGWDGIQCGNCFRGAEVHDNVVLNTGVAQVANQGSGFSINNGFQGDIYYNIVDNNIIMQPGKGLTRVFANSIVRNGGNDSIYIINDGHVADWNFDKTPTNGPYGGQWDGVTYYDGSATQLEFYANSMMTNRMAFYFLSKMPSNIMPSIKVYGNLVIYSIVSYNNFDPLRSPQAPADMPQRKLVYTASETGGFISDNVKSFQNVVRRFDDIDDLQLSNIVKVDTSISPGSTALWKEFPDPVFADMISRSNYLGKLFSAEGLHNSNAAGFVTIGANTLPAYTGGAYNPKYYNFMGGNTAENNAYTGPADTITIDYEANVLVVHDGVTAGGKRTVKQGATGFFMIGTKKYVVDKGSFVNIIETGGGGGGTTPTASGAVQNFNVVANTNQNAVNWGAPASNGGSAITSYKLYRGTASGSLTLFKTLSSSQLNYIDTEVTNGTKYYYQVTAVNGVGESIRSLEKSGMPLAASNDAEFVTVSGWDDAYPTQMGWLYKPAGYNNGNTNKYPLIIFLHGSGEIANSLTAAPGGITKLASQGLPLLLKNGQVMNSLVFCPQILNSDFRNDRPNKALNFMIANCRVDTNKVYLVGLSLGAQGVWYARTQTPQIFAAAIIASGAGSQTNTTGYNAAKKVNALWVGGDNDTTQPFYSSGVTTTPVALQTGMNTYGPAPDVPDQMIVIKGGTHSASVWNDHMFDKSKAGFDFEQWLLRFSLVPEDAATNFVTWIEGLVSAGKWDNVLFSVSDAQAFITRLTDGTVKTNLQARLNAVTTALDGRGKRFVIDLGAASGNYNYLASGAAAASVSSLKDQTNTASSYGLQVITAGTTGTTEFTTSNYFPTKCFGFTSPVMRNGFVVNGSGGQYKITGLNPAKTYRMLFLGGIDKTDAANPAELTITIGVTSKYKFTPGNNRDFIEFSGLTGLSELTFKAQSSPNLANSGSVTKLENGAIQTATSNISSFKSCDTYLNAVILIETTTI
ncbi:PKD domain-containing protein [Danxiaibacter flavus]|uniref:PKD domain-containing protein n=2 Tax=Pseudomonadati TaxID=3379134 RepID=A0ABV3ZI85_9BACT|nr:PKD domain-containing protein [Chitinophagaceae bacterium DXS]